MHTANASVQCTPHCPVTWADVPSSCLAGKVEKELGHDDGHLHLDEMTKLLQDMQEEPAELEAHIHHPTSAPCPAPRIGIGTLWVRQPPGPQAQTLPCQAGMRPGELTVREGLTPQGPELMRAQRMGLPHQVAALK